MRRGSIVLKIVLGSTAVGAGFLGVALTASDAEARLDLYVDKSAQQLSVIQNGGLLYVWPVSIGHDKHSTPNGVYTPERLERSWLSKAYYNAPMSHAIFFHNGYAIHGSKDISKLEGPASHGCIRLHPRDAALLFSMVQRAGPSNTAIFIGGDPHRPSLQSRSFDDQARLAYRHDDGVAHGARPPEPVMPPLHGGADRYVNGTSTYPPGPPPGRQSGPPMSPYYRSPAVDWRGPYSAGPDAAHYYEPDRYGDDGRSAPRGSRAEPYGNVDGRYLDGWDAPHGPGLRTDYRAVPQVDGRMALHSPPMPPDVDPYVDRAGVPYSPAVPPYYPRDRHADGRGVYPQPDPGPRPTGLDRYADGSVGPNGDQLTMRGNYLAPRLPALRPDSEAERTLHSSARTITAGSVGTKPGRLPDLPPGRTWTAGEAAKAPPPPIPAPAVLTPQPTTVAPPVTSRMEPPQERPQPEVGYRVLPRSYWAGASWRWRTKRVEEGVPRDPQ
jgi:hypothetical protein